MNNQYQNYAAARTSGQFGEMSSWKFVYPYLRDKITLDVGCSNGLYLQHMTEGSLGIEQVDELAKNGRSKGLNIITGDIDDSIRGLRDGEFESVLFSHVMEHIPCPINTLTQINRVLRTNGILILGLPIERNIYRDLLRMDYFDGTHIYAFSLRNTKKILEETGFKFEKVFFHLPKCNNLIGRGLEQLWNFTSIPFREYFSMAYWVIAVKQPDAP